MIQRAIAKVVDGQDLAEIEMTQVMEQIAGGDATPSQIGAFLVGLRTKGESVDEITAAAKVIRAKQEPIPDGDCDVCLDRDEINVEEETVLDTVGHGEDSTRTFNVSTTTAFVVAGAGLKVAKHGFRSMSTRCGSSDVLQALGLPLDMTPRQVGACVSELGIGFLYEHQSQSFMRHVIVSRREIGLRTIFNLLGPLSNPAGSDVLVMGVYRSDLTETMAEALKKLGCRSGLVVCGQDSLDEISITGPSKLTRLREGEISSAIIEPEDVGLVTARPEEILGGDAARNAAITRAVLQGEKGPRRDIVLLNTSAVLVAADKAPNLEDGLRIAAEAVDSGRAMEKLEKLVAMGNYKTGAPETPTGWGWSNK
jgi:anthranilate phosphoribosyltransferase